MSAGYATDREYGRVLGYVGTTAERAQESLSVLLSELQRINSPSGAVTPEEFARAMIGIRANLIFSGESTGARAGALSGDYYRLGRARSLDEIVAAFDAITLDSVNRYLAGRRMGETTIVTLGPVALQRPT